MPRYDYECPRCQRKAEIDLTIEEHETDENNPFCNNHEYEGIQMEKVITKMPLRTYTKRPQDRLWGTSHLSSSEKFKEKQKRKGDKK